MSFVIRQFEEDLSLGRKLKAMRNAANLTLAEMEAMTKIRKPYLAAFEEDAHDRLPAPLYARNYLRKYVRMLGGDEAYFLERFDAERGTCDFTDASRLPRARARRMQFLVPSRYLKTAVLALFAAGVLGYLGLELQAVISAPELEVHSPSDGLLAEEAAVTVSGKAEPDAQVQVNGEPVLLRPDGSFETEVVLERGLNVISVEGAKRYSRTAVEYRRVVLEQDRRPLTRAED